MGGLGHNRIQNLEYLSLEIAQYLEVLGMQHACVTMAQDLHL